MAASHYVVLSTCPDRDTAEEIAGTLVDEGHAACVNIIPGLTSVYQWKGEVCKDSELLLVIKTSKKAYRRVEETVIRIHPDELPEVVAVPIEAGLNDYLQWVTLQTQREE